MLLSLITSQMFSPLLLLMRLEFGIVRIDNNYWEFRYLDLNASALPSCKMESQSFQAGLMARSEHSFLNLENFCMLLMMLIIMDALQSQQQLMEKELFLEALKVKFVFGESVSRLKSWRHLWKSIEAEFGVSKLVRITPRLWVPAVMDHALYGTSRVEQDFSASLSQLPSSRPSLTLNNIRFLLLDLIERSPTGRSLMDKSSVLLRDLIANWIL